MAVTHPAVLAAARDVKVLVARPLHLRVGFVTVGAAVRLAENVEGRAEAGSKKSDSRKAAVGSRTYLAQLREGGVEVDAIIRLHVGRSQVDAAAVPASENMRTHTKRHPALTLKNI